MSTDKKYTAEEAARAVLAKAHEMLLAKGQNDGTHSANHSNNFDDTMKSKGVNKVLPKHVPGQGVTHGSSEMGNKVERGNMAGAKATAKATLGEMKAQPKPSIPGAAPGMAKDEPSSDTSSMGTKGIHKLSKFVGRMEGKKTPSHGGVETHRPEGQKGVHAQAPSANGSEGHSGATKEDHKRVLSEMKAQPKPGIPGGK